MPCEYSEYPCEYADYPVSTQSPPVGAQSNPGEYSEYPCEYSEYPCEYSDYPCEYSQNPAGPCRHEGRSVGVLTSTLLRAPGGARWQRSARHRAAARGTLSTHRGARGYSIAGSERRPVAAQHTAPGRRRGPNE